MIFNSRNDADDNSNYQKIVHDLAFGALAEQRRTRRWRIFFVSLFFVYLFAVTGTIMFSGPTSMIGEDGEHTALVKLNGVIASGEEGGAANVIQGLKAAFKNENTQGVILEINSPGGSPVQSSYIYEEIIALRDANPDIPLHTVITDIAASGGYFVASASDQIFVNRSSLVGSIGVRMDGFGFVGLMENLGIERRLLTAGKNKGLADPFLPEQPEQTRHLQTMLDEVHGHFIEAVKQGRGNRLKEVDGIFSGLIWSGEKSVEIGLTDGFGSTQSIARDLIGAEKVVDFTPKGEFIDRIASQLSSYLKLNLLQSPQYRF
ncbi:MAG: protease-4 [Gammaproteobacteria bacterium]|jgi:protease-4